MVTICVLSVPASDLIVFVGFKSHPIRLPFVGGCSILGQVILTPVGPPMTNIKLSHRIWVSSGLVPLFSGHLSFAEVVASKVEAVASCLWSLKVAISLSQRSCVVTEGILPCSKKLCLNNRGAIGVRVPARIGTRVCRVVNILA